MVTSRGHQTEKGQVLVLFTIIFVLVVLPLMAWVVDQGFLYFARRSLQKVVDSACLAGAIAIQNSEDKADRTANAQAAITASLAENNVDSAAFTPKDGSGAGLIKGIEINGSDIRVRVLQPTTTILSQFLGNPNGWEMAAGAHCETGLGGILPLAIKEFEGDCNSDILSEEYGNNGGNNGGGNNGGGNNGGGNNSEESESSCNPGIAKKRWSGPCTTKWTPYNPPNGIPPKDRDPEENCWVWGDWQALVGQEHITNDSDGNSSNSMNGLIDPDIRCQGTPSPDNHCPTPVFIPPVADGVNPNTLKDLSEDYIYAGGYNGPLPIIGNYQGQNSALIGLAQGTSASFSPKPVEDKYYVGEKVLVFVYKGGEFFTGNSAYDYVEVIGYAVVEIKYFNSAPNMVAVAPVYPPPNAAWDNAGNRLNARDFLPETLEEISDAGYAVYPILIEWD